MRRNVIERLRGNGTYRVAGVEEFPVTYDLRVLQDLVPTRPGKPPLPGLKDVQGRISADRDVFDLVGKEGVLELEDGRRLECLLTDASGQIAPRGDIQEPEGGS